MSNSMPTSESTLQHECEALAKDIFERTLEEQREHISPDASVCELRELMLDDVHATVDGHAWVIYHHKAHTLCLNCNTDRGEQALEDCGLPERVTYDTLGSLIAYHEMEARVMECLEVLIEGADLEVVA